MEKIEELRGNLRNFGVPSCKYFRATRGISRNSGKVGGTSRMFGNFSLWGSWGYLGEFRGRLKNFSEDEGTSGELGELEELCRSYGNFVNVRKTSENIEKLGC